MHKLTFIFLLLIASTAIQSQSFVITDVVISDSTQSLPDPEIDWPGSHVCFADQQGIWVGNIDKATGDFVPRSGKGVLVDSTPSYRGMQAVANGPEWAMSRNGSIVIYPDSVDNTNICIGTAKLVNGIWVAQRLPNSSNRIPYFGSYDDTYEKDGISCASYNPGTMAKTGTKLRNSTDTIEIAVTPVMSGHRWIKGMYAVSLSQEKQSPYKVGIFNATTQVYTEVASFIDLVDQSWIVPIVEGGSTYALWCIKKKPDQDEIAVYIQTGNTWQKTDSIRIPTDRKEIFSPEPFWWNGEAYIFLVARARTDQSSSLYNQVWIVSLESQNRLFRMVSKDEPGNRGDPEVFYTTTEPVIYYTETRRGVNSIHKCATGLSLRTPVLPLFVDKLPSQNHLFSITTANDGFLRMSGLLAGEQVRIIDLRGRCLMQSAAPSGECTFDISHIGMGTYALRSPCFSQRLIIGR